MTLCTIEQKTATVISVLIAGVKRPTAKVHAQLASKVSRIGFSLSLHVLTLCVDKWDLGETVRMCKLLHFYFFETILTIKLHKAMFKLNIKYFKEVTRKQIIDHN